MLSEKKRKELYDNGALNLSRFLDLAKIEKSDEAYDKSYAPLWYFYFPFVEIGLPTQIGEHGINADEARAKVLIRLQRGYGTGDYRADETIADNKRQAEEEDEKGIKGDWRFRHGL